MRVVDTLPLKLGAVLYPEHQKVKSLMIEEINNHGIDYEHKKVDAYAKGLEHFDYYSLLYLMTNIKSLESGYRYRQRYM